MLQNNYYKTKILRTLSEKPNMIARLMIRSITRITYDKLFIIIIHNIIAEWCAIVSIYFAHNLRKLVLWVIIKNKLSCAAQGYITHDEVCRFKFEIVDYRFQVTEDCFCVHFEQLSIVCTQANVHHWERSLD